MALGYDPNDPYGSGSLYQGYPDTGAYGSNGGTTPQPIDQGQGLSPLMPGETGYGGSGMPSKAFGANGNTGITGGMIPPMYGGGFTGLGGMNYNPYSTGSGALGGTGSGQVNWQGSSITPDQVNSYFASRGVTPNPTSANYFAQKWPELYQRGVELGNPNYAFQRLQYADEFLPGGPSTSPFYEGPQQGGSIGGTGTGQIASVTPSQSAGSVAPTWTAMLSNGSAYKKSNGIGGVPPRDPNQGLTLAELIGMGSR